MNYKGQPTPTTVISIQRAKVSDGKSIRVTVPENTELQAQSFALVEGFFGLVMGEVKTGPGETMDISLTIDQVEYETNQITAKDNFNKGDLIYFDETTNRLTTEPGNNILVGKVTLEKDNNNVINFILLDQQENIIDEDEL